MTPGIRFAHGRRSIVVALLALSAVLGLTASSSGSRDESADAMLARRLIQLATFRAAVGDDAGFEESVIFLQTAHELTPDDIEVDRRLVQAARRSGNTEAEFEARRRLLARDPDDHRNLLHVIRQGISERQSVADRLAAYERFLGPGGRSIPAAVRSRLAYDGAILQREHGDETAFLEWLKLSLSLDPYYREAAALAAIIVDAQSADPVMTAEALVQVLRADPASIAAIDDLSVLLVEAGAYTSARDLLSAMREIPPSFWGTQARTGLSLRLRLAHATAGAEGPAAGLALLTGLDRSLQARVSESDDSAEGFDARRFRVNQAAAILADAAQDSETRATALETLTNLVEEESETPLDARLELAIFKAWLDDDISMAQSLLDRRVSLTPEDHSLLKGWIALREATPDEARSVFGTAERGDVYRQLGVSLADHASGREQAAIRVWARLYADDPSSSIGLWAKYRLERELGRSFAASERASALAQLMNGVADDLRLLYTNPESLVTLRAMPSNQSSAPLDPIVMTVEIRNNSKWALPIGVDEFLPETVTVWPSLTVSGQRTAEQPLIADLSRRFRIAPGETITTRTRVDLSQLGLSLDQSPFVRFNLRYLVALNAAVDAEGRMRTTPLTISRDSRGGDRTPWSMSKDDLETRLDSISSGDAVARMEAITAYAQFVIYLSRLQQSGATTVDNWKIQAAESAINALREQWPNYDPSTQAWTVLHFRAAESIGANFRPLLEDLDDTMSRTTDPLVLLAWILTRAPSDDNPAWLAARRSDHPGVRRIAELRTRIMAESDGSDDDQPPDGQ